MLDSEFQQHSLEATMNIETPNDQLFNKYYAKHCKYLKLKGMQPKTVDAYSRAIRRIGAYFHRQPTKPFFFDKIV